MAYHPNPQNPRPSTTLNRVEPVILAEGTEAQTRSPRAHYGRTGTSGVRCIDLEELCGSVTTADELFEAFRLEGAL